MTEMGTHGRLFITFRRRHGVLTEPNRERRRDAPEPPPKAVRAMSSDDDFTHLDDQAFLAERRRIREELEHTPEHEISASLTDRYKRLNDEFLRRARLAWTRQLGGGARP
jgi:hypothetical protein